MRQICQSRLTWAWTELRRNIYYIQNYILLLGNILHKNMKFLVKLGKYSFEWMKLLAKLAITYKTSL